MEENRGNPIRENRDNCLEKNKENPLDVRQDFCEETYDMKSLKLVFWGILFSVINIRISGFDIVPDFIGYIMIVFGLSKIEKYEQKFSAAKKLSCIMIVLSLLNLYQEPASSPGAFGGTTGGVNFSAGIFGPVPWLATVFLIVGLIVTMYFFYSLCTGLKILLNKVGDTELANQCDGRWKLILAASIGILSAYILVLLSTSVGTLMILIFGVLSLIAMVLLLALIHQAQGSIHQKSWKKDIL